MKYGLGVLFTALLVWLDQWTKQLAVEHLKSGPYVIWEGVFELRYSINKGAAFGILQNQRIFFIITTCIVLAAIVYCYHKIPATKKNLPLLMKFFLRLHSLLVIWHIFEDMMCFMLLSHLLIS